MIRGCEVVGCERPHNAHGLCGMHGQRVRRTGVTGTAAMDPSALPKLERFMHYVEKTDYCWNWVGTRSVKGYGRIRWAGVPRPAHRVSYEELVGPIPEGLEIDHLCENRACVNPDHLEPVTRSENVMRVYHRHKNRHCAGCQCPSDDA